MPRKPSEEGAALLAVLLLVAVMSALAAASLERLQLSTRLAGNIVALDQARAYATGAESLAVLRINDLLARDAGKTTLEGDWHGEETALPLPDGGVALARVWDGGNCFNLNSVARGGDPLALEPDQLAVQQFAALMRGLEIPNGDAERIAWSLADWIDGDERPLRAGGEDTLYSRADTPYRPGNTLLAEVSELRAIAGVTGEYYQRLRPWLCTLPTTELSPINVNTLSTEQAPLIAMLMPYQINLAVARQAIEARPAVGWNSIADFWQQPVLAGFEPSGEVIGQPQIRTRYFRLELDVRLGETEVEQVALIDASAPPARTVSRRWGREE
ncbi:MAG: type II secretion system minor pseudopilin GspK [Sphingomonadaceae bacterium]|nr:type II secretion system minor pseudopilin GspK [Sphingomonadaceae bacterium]